ncbi:MAG TPA: hypothetical protein VFX70_21855 [Mycobacteriales bacterium]|nr:hypothetical protein [Mycobacteriales bacterium]
MAVLILLAVTAFVIAGMTLPGRRRQVTAARWRHALRTLRQDRPPTRPPAGLPELYQAPEHVRVIRPRGRITER